MSIPELVFVSHPAKFNVAVLCDTFVIEFISILHNSPYELTDSKGTFDEIKLNEEKKLAADPIRLLVNAVAVPTEMAVPTVTASLKLREVAVVSKKTLGDAPAPGMVNCRVWLENCWLLNPVESTTNAG
jgi:hypothetical protein